MHGGLTGRWVSGRRPAIRVQAFPTHTPSGRWVGVDPVGGVFYHDRGTSEASACVIGEAFEDLISLDWFQFEKSHTFVYVYMQSPESWLMRLCSPGESIILFIYHSSTPPLLRSLMCTKKIC
jgi:hypothetical protein